MHRKKRYAAYVLLAVIDVAIIVGSLLAASVLYLGSVEALGGLNATHSLFGPVGAWMLVVAYACLLTTTYAVSRVYGCTYIGQIGKMAKRVAVINTFGLAFVVVLLYVFHLDDVSRMTLVIFYVLSTTASIFKNWVAFRIFYYQRKHNRRIQSTLVVGNGLLAQRYAATISENDTRLEDIVGHVRPLGAAGTTAGAAATDAAADEDALGAEVVAGEGLRAAHEALGTCLGSASELDSILFHAKVDKIVIALDPSEYATVQPVMAMADKYGTLLELVPFYNDFMPRRPDIDAVDDVKLVNLRSMPLSNPLNAAVKRLVDIATSSVIIVAFSWMYVIVAIGVKATSPGPVFFKQERVGLNNKTFNMLKFRSMRVNDESDTAWSTDEDPRKTKFGSFIRKFSIDELPQFFNVFVGDMSIVGPRPEIPHHVSAFREDIPRYMVRHQVRPGITGWAQVNGLRGDTSVRDRIEADLWYIENWSLWLDARIFVETIFGGFVNSEEIAR